jgi:hypothetical protein
VPLVTEMKGLKEVPPSIGFELSIPAKVDFRGRQDLNIPVNPTPTLLQTYTPQLSNC